MFLQPRMRNPYPVSHAHGLASSTFARHYLQNHSCFLLLRVLRCFTSPRNPPTNYFLHWRVTTHNHGRVSPFGHPRINAHQATPRGLTQPITSFIGLAYPGIHHAPYNKKHKHIVHAQTTKNTKNKTTKKKNKQQPFIVVFYRIRVHYTVLTQHTTPQTTPTNQQSGILPTRGDSLEQHSCCPRYPTACQKTKQTINQSLNTNTLCRNP